MRSSVKPELTGSILEMFFSYDPATGIFLHKTKRGPRGRGIGGVAGSFMKNGYLVIGTPDGGKILAHRLAWLWMTGRWPTIEIDHINGDRADNRFCNLREATRKINSGNMGYRKDSITKRVGVSFDRFRKMYVARLMMNGVSIFQKRYVTIEEAVIARENAEMKYLGYVLVSRQAWQDDMRKENAAN